MEELKPCPFCNSTDIGVFCRHETAFVYCAECYAQGPDTNDEAGQAAIAWNRRAGVTEVPVEGKGS